MKPMTACFIFCATLHASGEDIAKIKDLYASTFAKLHEAKTMSEMERLTDGFLAPEWVGEMPAGETITRADAMHEGEMAVALPPEKRPAPKFHFLYITETGWNILAVYWQYRQDGRQRIGALCRDTWVRTAQGWRRVRTEKLFPDRPLNESDLLPPLQ